MGLGHYPLESKELFMHRPKEALGSNAAGVANENWGLRKVTLKIICNILREGFSRLSAQSQGSEITGGGGQNSMHTWRNLTEKEYAGPGGEVCDLLES